MVQKTLKSSIEQALKDFSRVSTSECVKHLFETLGYSTQLEVMLDTHTPDEVVEVFGWESLREDKGLLNEWESVDCLFQVTENEITESSQLGLFQPSWDKDYLKSYLFMGLTLQNPHYSRSQLAGITREINRQSPIPIMVLFRYGETVTLSIINRRPNQKDRDEDVLEKVTLIKDININFPHRAHIEILSDLALVSLKNVRNFDELHTAWQKVLDTSELNKKFFQEVSNWYFWAISTVTFPDGAEKDESIRNATSVIRLITRLIFVWFLKEKGLVPWTLFEENELKGLLKSLELDESTYYKAILQNLFFATLNTEMNTDTKSDNRKFRGQSKQKGGRDQHYGVTNVYRYQDYFINSDKFLELCQDIPFLNGGLFECLDRDREDSFNPETSGKTKVSGKGNEKTKIRIDGFSDREDNVLDVPNVLFFGEETDIDLNKIYGTRKKKYKVQGLIEIFNRYKFTIDENTPIEEEIALDPELLGKVFENLLAEYNPETETTARKQTGSFYTPREIVNYMVDESLIAYLANILLNEQTGFMELGSSQPNLFGNDYNQGQLSLQTPIDANPYQGKEEALNNKLRHLLSYNNKEHQFNDKEVDKLINAIDHVKIIDIACGSGAFPMGILQKLVFILGKLDPNNSKWKQQQKEKAIQPVLKDIQVAKQISYEDAREEAIQKLEERLAEIEDEFNNNEMDYPRKLFLIENCIFGVDIQPIAVQISKLRFFISLIVDQTVNNNQPNRGILPLPNLETKFVAANSLIGLETQLSLRSQEVIEKEEELKQIRQQHFKARTPKTKKKCRDKDRELRQEISQLLQLIGLESATADTLARWNPYDLNTSSDFFDPTWMFGVDSFDICIGNPPYIGQKGNKNIFTKIRTGTLAKFYQRNCDIFYFFFHLSLNIVRTQGCVAFITTNYYLTADSAETLRKDLKDRANIKKLVDFNELSIFESAKGQHNIITIFSKATKLREVYNALVITTNRRGNATPQLLLNIFSGLDSETTYLYKSQTELYEGIKSYIRIKNTSTLESNLSSNGNNSETILAKIQNLSTTTLGKICQVGRGLQTGADKVTKRHIDKNLISSDYKNHGIYIVSQDELNSLQLSLEEMKIVKPFFKNSDIQKYYCKSHSDKFVFYLTRNLEINNYPNIYNHLLQFTDVINSRSQNRGEIQAALQLGKWWVLFSAKEESLFNSPKIVCPQRSVTNCFAYTDSAWYSSCDVYYIVKISDTQKFNLIYLLGILNSKLYYFWLYFKGKRKGDNLELYYTPLTEIPLCLPSTNKKELIIKLVTQILETKRQNPNADTRELEREIDEIVYELYGLSEEEIRIIEESVKGK